MHRQKGQLIEFTWKASHMEISENEEADELARNGTTKPPVRTTNFPSPSFNIYGEKILRELWDQKYKDWCINSGNAYS